jgi:hypothetical protein
MENKSPVQSFRPDSELTLKPRTGRITAKIWLRGLEVKNLLFLGMNQNSILILARALRFQR